MAQRTMVMNIDLEGDEEINLIKDARARSNACYKCGEVGHFQRDCKYDGDKPTDNQQGEGGQSPLDSYDPVVGKWMATTPITVKAMKNLYAELNRLKGLKRTYRKKYKDFQAVVTTAEHNVTLQKPSPQVLKVTLGGNGKGPICKGKSAKPLHKRKTNAAKPPTSKSITSTSPSMNPRDKAKDWTVVTLTMLQDLVEELQAIEQESLDDGHNSEATQESDLEQEDNEDSMTQVKEQSLTKMKVSQAKTSENYEPTKYYRDIETPPCQLNSQEEYNVKHAEEIIIGSEQGTTFPTKVGTTVCNALKDTGATRCYISEEYYRKLQQSKFIYYKMLV